MNETARWVLEEWARGLEIALEAMTGAEARTRTKDGAEAPESTFMFWEQPFGAAGEIDLTVAIPDQTWRGLGGEVMRCAGVEDCGDGDRRSSFIELLQQSFSSLARSIGAKIGRELLCGRGSESAADAKPCAWSSVELALGALPPLALAISIPSSLLDLLAPAISVPASSCTEVAPVEAGTKTMDLLLEVEMPVSVSFGRAQMRLKDVIKLNTGSIVELNRSISEPVEVIVNNCVIARGEVVMVEGNYGVRINQIVSRQERLRTLY
jgi:flagellar motor switch protein FliN/FliY